MQNEAVADLDRIEEPALSGHDLTPEECMALARYVAERIELGALERGGEGSSELLWRSTRRRGSTRGRSLGTRASMTMGASQ
jgi:hypothetical protein